MGIHLRRQRMRMRAVHFDAQTKFVECSVPDPDSHALAAHWRWQDRARVNVLGTVLSYLTIAIGRAI